MTKDKFLLQLYHSLDRIPKSERDDLLQDYEEHFDFGLAEGKTESEIANALGEPQQLAKEILATYHFEQAKSKTSTKNVFRALFSIMTLGFFNLMIVFAPAAVIALFVFAGWLAGIGFMAAPLLLVVNMILSPGAFATPDLAFTIFSTLGICGVGCFITFGMYYVTKWVKKIFLKYLQWNIQLVKGGSTNEI